MTRRSSPLMLVGIVLLSLNLFPAAVSIGPVLTQVRTGLGMNDWQVAAMTAVPLLAFAALRALSATAARIFGVHRIALIAVLLIAVGLFSRALADHAWVFLLLTVLAACGSGALAPLLPMLTRRHFPRRVRMVTLIYSTAATVAAVLALALTRPLSHSDGGWRTALAVWGAVAVVATLPWLNLVGHDRAHRRQGREPVSVHALRTSLGWALSGAFGLQTAQVFTVLVWFPTLWDHHGYTPAQAALLVALVAAASIPLALFVPAAARQRRDPRAMLVGTLLCFPLAYAGLLLRPHGAAIVCALLLGVGAVGTPLARVLIRMRARSRHAATALADAAQSVGYVVAAAVVFGFGALRHVSEDWTGGLVALLALAVVQLLLAWYVGRPAYLEDQLPAQAETQA